jgi:hypothetical protein
MDQKSLVHTRDIANYFYIRGEQIMSRINNLIAQSAKEAWHDYFAPLRWFFKITSKLVKKDSFRR